MSDIIFLDCPNHGLQPHFEEHGVKICDACDSLRKDDPPAFRALALNIPFYNFPCPTHGEVLHRVKLNTCTLCYDTARQPRAPSSIAKSARALARTAGEKTYVDVCEAHGETAHSVGHGKCLTCYTSGGVVRVGASTAPSLRAVARKAGETSYLDWCGTHGVARHTVVHGKCLGCFTTAGIKRVFKPRERI